MHKNLKNFGGKSGFTGIEIVLFLAFMTVVSVAAIFADYYEVGRPFSEIIKKGLSNPFPPHKQEPTTPPIEINNNPYIDHGKPIINTYSATGEWHGDYRVTYPKACDGISGKWSARLAEDNNGNITGNFTSDFGESGSVTGHSIGGAANWKVESGQGLKFNGGITGNTITGDFSNGSTCGYSAGEEPAAGNFFGGRVVEQ